MQAVEQHEHLLQGLETTSAMLPRLRLMEDLYLHLSAKLTPQLINEFTEILTSIYSKVIEFQARALYYLRKHSVSPLFRDLFKQDEWEDLVQDMQRLEGSAESFTSLMESAELREKLDGIQEALSKDQIWRTTSKRDERVKRLCRMFYACRWPSHFRRAFDQDAQEAARLGYRLCQTVSNIFATWLNEFEKHLPSDCTAISIASYLGLTAIVRPCLDTEIEDVDSRDPLGRTALSLAVTTGHKAVVKLLLDTGRVDVDSEDERGRTPLSFAAEYGHEAVLKLLLDTEKVDMNSKYPNG